MKEFVLDCSATMAWCFSDEATRETEDLLDSLTACSVLALISRPLYSFRRPATF